MVLVAHIFLAHFICSRIVMWCERRQVCSRKCNWWRVYIIYMIWCYANWVTRLFFSSMLVQFSRANTMWMSAVSSHVTLISCNWLAVVYFLFIVSILIVHFYVLPSCLVTGTHCLFLGSLFHFHVNHNLHGCSVKSCHINSMQRSWCCLLICRVFYHIVHFYILLLPI